MNTHSDNDGQSTGLGSGLAGLNHQDELRFGNLYANSAAPAEGERFEPLLLQDGLLIERIVSSPRIAHEEYCQPHAEWVLLAQGSATLDVAGESIHLRQGDYLYIPAQMRHTVLSVSDGAIWLAIHLGGRAQMV